ncbi:single-stranded DNA-binding protein [Micropruina sp.]|uniref:single-stranded DNA-binding protein n=1 Tax=Micropruina sp. TaxID=2737536 RepID=UPI0039E655DF
MDATITVTGNVGSGVDLRTGPNNEWAYAAFRLASTPRVLRQGHWRDGDTTWLNINCRNRSLALNVHASIAKGDPVMVTGRLTTWTWIKKDTGEVQERIVLEAVSVGHDLGRGTTTFQRTERALPEPPAPDPSVFDMEPPEGESGETEPDGAMDATEPAAREPKAA